MMNCVKCGKLFDEKYVVCPHCGMIHEAPYYIDPAKQAKSAPIVDDDKTVAFDEPAIKPVQAIDDDRTVAFDEPAIKPAPAPVQPTPVQPVQVQQVPVQPVAPVQPVVPVQPVQPVAVQPVPVQVVQAQPVQVQVVPTPPAIQLRHNRKYWKLLVFGFLTLGIYRLVVWIKWSSEINITASKYDGKKTMNFALVAFLLSGITLGIVPLVWMTKFSSRVGAEARRRGMVTSFGGGTFWLFAILLSFIAAGPIIYTVKLCKCMNYINKDYNQRG